MFPAIHAQAGYNTVLRLQRYAVEKDSSARTSSHLALCIMRLPDEFMKEQIYCFADGFPPVVRYRLRVNRTMFVVSHGLDGLIPSFGGERTCSQEDAGAFR